MGLNIISNEILRTERAAVANNAHRDAKDAEDPGEPAVALSQDRRGSVDNYLDRIRKFVPPELALSWAAIKNIVQTDSERNDVVAGFWVFFVAYTPIHVYILCRREALSRAKRLDTATIQSNATFLMQALLSTFSFVLYTMTLGAPFSGDNAWGLPSYLSKSLPFLFILLVGLFDPSSTVRYLGLNSINQLARGQASVVVENRAYEHTGSEAEIVTIDAHPQDSREGGVHDSAHLGSSLINSASPPAAGSHFLDEVPRCGSGEHLSVRVPPPDAVETESAEMEQMHAYMLQAESEHMRQNGYAHAHAVEYATAPEYTTAPEVAAEAGGHASSALNSSALEQDPSFLEPDASFLEGNESDINIVPHGAPGQELVAHDQMQQYEQPSTHAAFGHETLSDILPQPHTDDLAELDDYEIEMEAPSLRLSTVHEDPNENQTSLH